MDPHKTFLHHQTRRNADFPPGSAILSLCCEAADLRSFLSELRSRLSSSPGHVTLSQEEAESLILSDHVISNLLPGKTVVINWEPLKPVEANLEVLRRRGLTFIADHGTEPSVLSLGSPLYAVPYRHNAMHVNVFDSGLASVCEVFLAQLETLPPSLTGSLVINVYVNLAVWAGLRRFCQDSAKVAFFRDYWEEVILESDL